ncbi:heliorhodopsin HeR [Candidatus Saccharibacteria bacterium]|nr:heliorhodopsin HeR [Candidatus Saccharibacteria bacterium]
MATRKTTTKAKSKTTKKPATNARSAAAKSARATKSAKTTKPVAKKATVVKTTTAVKIKSAQITTDALRKLNLITAFVLAALAVAAGMLMNSASYALNIGYQGKDELVSLTSGKTAFVHASQSVADVQVKWFLVTILGLAVLFSLLNATRMRRKYEANLDDGVSAWRWIAIGVTSGLMLELVALLGGVSDIMTLKLISGLIFVTCALGWVAEKRNKQAGRPAWSEFVISLFTGSLPWLLIVSYAVFTWTHGLIRYSWFVYALHAALLVGFILLTINQYKRIGGWKNTRVVERNYLLIGFATKVAFAAILILAFQK